MTSMAHTMGLSKTLFQNAMSALMTEYLGGCKRAGVRWPARIAEFTDRVEENPEVGWL